MKKIFFVFILFVNFFQNTADAVGVFIPTKEVSSTSNRSVVMTTDMTGWYSQKSDNDINSGVKEIISEEIKKIEYKYNKDKLMEYVFPIIRDNKKYSEENIKEILLQSRNRSEFEIDELQVQRFIKETMNEVEKKVKRERQFVKRTRFNISPYTLFNAMSKDLTIGVGIEYLFNGMVGLGVMFDYSNLIKNGYIEAPDNLTHNISGKGYRRNYSLLATFGAIFPPPCVSSFNIAVRFGLGWTRMHINVIDNGIPVQKYDDNFLFRFTVDAGYSRLFLRFAIDAYTAQYFDQYRKPTKTTRYGGKKGGRGLCSMIDVSLGLGFYIF